MPVFGLGRGRDGRADEDGEGRGRLSPGNVRVLAESFRPSLVAENRSLQTLATYGEALRQFADFLDRHGMPTEVANIRREHLEAFVADLLEHWKPATASNTYRALRSVFRWTVEEGEVDASPMANMKPPTVPEDPPPVLGEDALRRLLKATEGTDVEARRYRPILLLLLDTGVRRGELAG